MRRIILMVGLPASGKSTAVKYLGGNSKTTVSFDNALLATIDKEEYNIAYEEYTKSKELRELVRQKVDNKFKELMKSNLDFFIDLTNITRKDRIYWINKIRKIDKVSSIDAFAILPPLERILKQNDNRKGKVIPIDVIHKMGRKFEYPEENEGLNTIYEFEDSEALVKYK